MLINQDNSTDLPCQIVTTYFRLAAKYDFLSERNMSSQIKDVSYVHEGSAKWRTIKKDMTCYIRGKVWKIEKTRK